MEAADIINPGTKRIFHYSMGRPDPADVNLFALANRTGQEVTVLGICPDGEQPEEGSTFKERCEDGMQCLYRIRFPDGHEGSAFEDELYTE